ncbi:MAG: hypothetical protein QW197_00805 [Candidatus Aenigmatarchaeota archaeon]
MNISIIEEFLNFLCSGYEGEKIYWELRVLHQNNIYLQEFFERKIDVLSFFKKNLEKLKDKDCYIGLLPRVEKIGSREAVKFGNVFVIDLDSEKAIEDYRKIYDKLFSFNIPPSLIANSGNGIHVYYKVNKLVEIEKWKLLQQGLLNFFIQNFDEYNVDKVVKDEARIIRVIGTINNKKEPKQTSILYSSNIKYDLEYFEDFVKNFLDLKDLKKEEKIISRKIGRFEVMALLQAARYYLLKGDLEKAKSFGLNRAIFYAWAKHYGPQYSFKGKSYLLKDLEKDFEIKSESERKWEIVGNEKAPIDTKSGFFIMGDKPQLPKDFDINIARKFERIDNFQNIWSFVLEYLKTFDIKDLEDQQRFFDKVYKPIRDNFEEFYKKGIKREKKSIFDYLK